ncbi:MAG: cytidylate kinase family protein, partial [Lachnospiraceae bacterium]|nr:cytidylate kinase family protein [Lachnospiraceae bacterium]
ETIRKEDKQRATYYNYYATGTWGDVSNYHLCLDSGEVGVDGCIRAVLAYMGEIELLNEFVEGRVGEDD